jgi:hypothetical protein
MIDFLDLRNRKGVRYQAHCPLRETLGKVYNVVRYSKLCYKNVYKLIYTVQLTEG